MLINLKILLTSPLPISVLNKIGNALLVGPFHRLSHLPQNKFPILILILLNLEQNIAHIKLQTPNKRHLNHEGANEVLEHVDGFLLEVDGFVVLELEQGLVVED